MQIDESTNIVMSVLQKTLSVNVEITNEMQLIGGEALLDSMQLVEVCLALEDVADEYDFEFDWTSHATMSKSRSMFRNVAALVEEFAKQSER